LKLACSRKQEENTRGGARRSVSKEKKNTQKEYFEIHGVLDVIILPESVSAACAWRGTH
jgi:hypothetical protein